MIKNPVLSLLFLLLTYSLAAQSCTVVKTDAFSRRLIPGNITVDNQPEGKPEKPRFIYEVYLQTTCSKLPQITAAWINGVHYTTAAMPVAGNKAIIGIYQNKGDTAVVQKAANRFLYKIEFQEADISLKIPASYRYKTTGKILLMLNQNGKVAWQLTPPIQLLESDVMY